MDKIEAVKSIIKNNGGIAKTADFVAESFSNYDVANLCKEGYIERVRHGYYQLSEQEDIKEEQMLAPLLPESIICVESVLFYYGYSDIAPRQWTIAVPRTFSRTKLKIDSLVTKVYFVQPALFEIGKTTGDFNGVQSLFMIGSAPFATVPNTAQSRIIKCSTRCSMLMLPIKRKT